MGILDNMIKGYAEAIVGPNPADLSDAYSSLQTELNSKYDKQKQAFEADPNNQGKAYQMPDPLQRWNDQIAAMMTSNNSTLQKEALAQMSQYQQHANAVGADHTPNSVREYQFAQQQGFQGSYQDWIQSKAAAGRQNISINNVMPGQGTQGINFLSPEEKERLNLPQGTAYYVDKNGQIKEPPGSKEGAVQQQAVATQMGVAESEDLLFSKGGIYDTTEKAMNDFNVPKALKRPAEAAYSVAQQYIQDDPRYAQQEAINSNLAANIGRAYLGEKGVMTDFDVNRIKKLLPDPVNDNRATAQRKIVYIKKILNETDPSKVKAMVYGDAKPTVSKSVDNNLDSKVAPKQTDGEWKEATNKYKYRILE